MTFEEYCIRGARQFLQTALVIDDQADLSGAAVEAEEPKVATRTGRQSIRGKRAEMTQSVAEQTAEMPGAAPDGPAEHSGSVRDSEAETYGRPAAVDEQRWENGRKDGDSDSRLDAKTLTDAFLEAEVICGVYKPTADDRSIPLAVKAAKRADIVVVDWFLQGNSSVKAKRIIKAILLSDVQEHGRLRLMAVYTSQPGLQRVAQELFAAIEEEPDLRGRLKLEGATLCGCDTRICVVNKEGASARGDELPVPESKLPEHLLKEFVKLTDGLLANFAVSAIAAVRRGAHHVLARFRKELDGVYLAHRISLTNPDAAEDMALERVSVELSSLIENADIPGMTLRVPTIDAWLEHQDRLGRKFKNAKIILPLDLMKELVRHGEKRLKTFTGQLQVHDNSPATKDNCVSVRTILDVFFPSPQAARLAAREFARLTGYKREVGRVRLDAFKPRLTLGALVKVRRDLGNSDLYKHIDGDFLLCIQPRCDSVRLEGSRTFPFQQAKYDKGKFNLIVDETGADGYLLLDSKPMSTIMLTFRPDEGKDAIFANKEGASYLFADEQGRVFEWMGDLDDLKAQRFASEIGANMHRVGVDELEWLRRGAAGDIKPEAQPPKPTKDDAGST